LHFIVLVRGSGNLTSISTALQWHVSFVITE
jgi:hypothetical protein